jgi:hypothetical protein
MMPRQKCPNCQRMTEGGLSISETGIRHCGCYWDADDSLAEVTFMTDAEMDWRERNAPCPCGSGAKYKRCCGHRRTKEDSQ